MKNDGTRIDKKKIGTHLAVDNNQYMMSPEDLELESISQRGGLAEKWDDIGLSKTPLNERYFSQPDLEKAMLNGN